MSFGWGAPLPVSRSDFRLSRKTTHFGAAVMHELHRLLPTLVFEEDDGPFVSLIELETYLCAQPFLGPVDHLPQQLDSWE